MQDRFGHRISYLRVSVTDRCNERCRYCMPDEVQEWLPRAQTLTYPELLRAIRVGVSLGVNKVRITGGEPLTRPGIVSFVAQVAKVEGVEQVGVSTNGTLLARRGESGEAIAQELKDAGATALNISLDTLDRSTYATVTGRDFLPRLLGGIEAARAAKFDHLRVNCVLMRGRNDEGLVELVEFACQNNLLLRFIELMPVSAREVLDDANFFPIREAQRKIEGHFGTLIPLPDFRTNGPAVYYRIPGREQRVGFIGALTNLHFCETCNKLRLTSDGKLRPCLGSHLEVDIFEALRQGAGDDVLRAIFRETVEQKPEQHDFRGAYQPQRRMIAIGG